PRTTTVTLPLRDALPICTNWAVNAGATLTINAAIQGAGTQTVTKSGAGTLILTTGGGHSGTFSINAGGGEDERTCAALGDGLCSDRKSTRLNSSHQIISY